MSDRVQLLRAHIEGLNAAGVRRTAFYSLAHASLRGTLGEPLQLRRAKAEAYILDHAPLAVHPFEPIVGSLTALCPLDEDAPSYEQLSAHAADVIEGYLQKKRAGVTEQRPQGIRTFEQEFSGKQSRWALMSRVHRDACLSYPEFQRLIAEMGERYGGVPDIEPYEIARELERALKFDYGEAKRAVDELPWFAANHLSLGYAKAVKMGLRGIEAQIAQGAGDAEGEEQRQYYAAARLVIQAAQRFILRYANAVSGEANRTGGARGEELKRIAALLRRVCTEPAQSFLEGVQLSWMLHCMMSMLGGSALSFGRFDQYLGALYDQDIREERITRDEAHELLCCLWLKINEPMLRTVQSLTLGGVTRDGNDAANELTRLCLEVVRDMKLPYPNVGVRINNQNPEWLIEAVTDSILEGAGQPMVMNDSVWILNLVRLGHKLSDANDYYNMGCVEIMVPDRMPNWGVTDPIAFPMLIARVFERRGELALQTFDQFLMAYKHELKLAVQLRYAEGQQKRAAIPGVCYDPFASLFIEGCLERGRDLFQGGSALGTHWSVYAYGLGTAADALAALKKWVYDAKKLTLQQMDEVLQSNFDGREQLRRMLTCAPHYGNDDDGADQIAQAVLGCFNEAVFALNAPSSRDKYVSTLFGYFFHIYHGEITGATPNGRRRGEPFSDSMGPSQGMDVCGPTAMLNSALKLGSEHITGGYALNMKLNPALMRGDGGPDALRALIDGYFEGGGSQIQFNFVDAETLRDARQHPEKHGDLIVRIGGYCEYFVNLDARLQQEIITRTVHGG